MLGPFQPGDGGLPPFLAGRESEQDVCRAFMRRLRHGRPPPREIIFYGPRGNGKTALLVWLQREAASFPGVDVIRLVPAAIRAEGTSRNACCPPPGGSALLRTRSRPMGSSGVQGKRVRHRLTTHSPPG